MFSNPLEGGRRIYNMGEKNEKENMSTDDNDKDNTNPNDDHHYTTCCTHINRSIHVRVPDDVTPNEELHVYCGTELIRFQLPPVVKSPGKILYLSVMGDPNARITSNWELVGEPKEENE
jgi:hypothetical protein